MKEKIQRQIQETLKKLGIDKEVDFSIEHPEDFKNGDYSSNVAMVYAKKIGMNPKELAEKIVNEINNNPFPTLPLAKGEGKGGGLISNLQIAGPGFINFYLSREFFTDSIEEILKQKENWGKNKLLEGKKVMVEYTDPNPFKPFHIGHLMANAIGESISRIVEFSGAETIRANYQGDVGPHVAKAIYIMLSNEKDLNYAMEDVLSINGKASYIGECYSKGSNLYDTDENIKKEIDILNKKIYEGTDEKIKRIYEWGKDITMKAFEEIYDILGTKFNRYYLESKMAPIGEKIVRENIGKVFDESDGAIVFHGENYDKKLHTRVFVNSQGLPTYETKEIGLTLTKFEEYNPHISIITTAIEQAEYMKVVQKAISLIYPELESRMKHVTHGMMKLSTGKMSSRKGNVVTGESLINDSIEIINEKIFDRDFENDEKNIIAKKVGVAALKYSILKSALGSDIVYDFDKSISFEGDSGPYLQYTAVRANSILEKAKEFNQSANTKNQTPPLEVTNLEKLIYQFPEVVEHSYLKLEPHHLATYLTELASDFNSFYGNTKILEIDNKYINYQLKLVQSFYLTMKNGLWLLGIETPEKM